MIRWNICVSTLTTVEPCKEHLDLYIVIELDDSGEKVWVHQHVSGVLPVILQNLWCERKKVKNIMKMAQKDTMEGRAVFDLLNAKQLAIKISMNSIYGIFGAKVGDMAYMELSRAVCAVGRSMIDALVTSIDTNHKDMDVIYGDSVAASTPIVFQHHGNESSSIIRCSSIESFWYEIVETSSSSSLPHIPGIMELNYHADKEAFQFFSDVSTPFQIYSDEGWTDILRIIRHKPKSTRLYRIRVANGSQVEVTGDHSLLLSDGTCIQPAKVKIGDTLMTKDFEGRKGNGVAQLGANKFIGIPDFSKDVGQNEMHLFDLYHTQLMIQYLGPMFVEVIVSGQTFKIVYNVSPDPFFCRYQSWYCYQHHANQY